MKNQCPHCGAPLPEEASFCPHCARSLNRRVNIRRPFSLSSKVLRLAALLILIAAVCAAGYFLTRPWMRRYDGWLFVLGAVTAAVSIRIMMVRPDYEGIIFNGSILICGITWAITAAAIRCERFLSPLSSVLSFIGRHSFTILLIHWLGLYGILLPGYIPGLMARGTVVRLAGTFGLTMAISLAVALVFDNFIFPGLQRIFSRTAS